VTPSRRSDQASNCPQEDNFKYKAIEKVVKGGIEKIWEKIPVALTAVFRGLPPRGRSLLAALALGTFCLYNSIMRQRFRRVKQNLFSPLSATPAKDGVALARAVGW